MDSPRVLIVDDDDRIAAALQSYFERDGYQVARVRDGQAALEAVVADAPDLVLLDLNLPEIDGLEVCRRLRESRAIPILMVTARTTLDDRLRGLDMGADDYITKPFSPREVVARARAVLRRSRPLDGAQRFGALEIDRRSRTVRVGGKTLALTDTEWKLFDILTTSPRAVFSRAQLIESVLGYDYAGTERTIDTHVTNVRRKLGAAGSSIATVFGAGYRFEPPQ